MSSVSVPMAAASPVYRDSVLADLARRVSPTIEQCRELRALDVALIDSGIVCSSLIPRC
jgi:hypothetical protein